MAKKQFKIVKGRSYRYIDIVEYFNNLLFDEEQYGPEYAGENFLVFKDPGYDIKASFVLTGVVDDSFLYECVYSEL